MCKIVPRYALHHRVASSRSLYFLLSLSFALLFNFPPPISRKSLFLISFPGLLFALSSLCSFFPSFLSSHPFSVPSPFSPSLLSLSLIPFSYSRTFFQVYLFFYVSFSMFFSFYLCLSHSSFVSTLFSDNALYSFCRNIVVYK